MEKPETSDDVNDVRAKLDTLSKESPIRTALANKTFEECLRQGNTADPHDAHLRPATLGFLEVTSVEGIREFDSDLALVLQNTAASKRSAVTDFLRPEGPSASNLGKWYGRLFDVVGSCSISQESSQARF